MRRKNVFAVSAAFAAFLVAIGFAVQSRCRAEQYERLLENSYTHAYRELTTAVSELDAALQKAPYAVSPIMLEALCTDIYGKALAAQMALGELPDSGVLLEQTSAFLARTGDYALALTRTAASEGGCGDETRAALHALADASSCLSASLLTLQSDLDCGAIPIGALIQAEDTLAPQAGGGQAQQGGTAFQMIEAEFPEIPSLIYDGPFSEHISQRTPLALEGLAQVSQEDARAAAAAFLGLPTEAVQPAGSGEGRIPTWDFSAQTDGGEWYAEVTRQGGKVLSLLSFRTAGEPAISPENALHTAQEFLRTWGYESMEESYHIQQGGTLTFHFAPVEQGVFCYPDLVKVSVALDTGAVTGFEAHGWTMNHTARSFSSPAVGEEDARAAVSPELEILAHQLALIPTGGEYEVLCHEFKCRTPEDSHVIVYVNAATGNGERLLLLLEDENGTLVW